MFSSAQLDSTTINFTTKERKTFGDRNLWFGKDPNEKDHNFSQQAHIHTHIHTLRHTHATRTHAHTLCTKISRERERDNRQTE